MKSFYTKISKAAGWDKQSKLALGGRVGLVRGSQWNRCDTGQFQTHNSIHYTLSIYSSNLIFNYSYRYSYTSVPKVVWKDRGRRTTFHLFREAVKRKWVSYGQANRKGCPPPSTVSFLLFFFMGCIWPWIMIICILKRILDQKSDMWYIDKIKGWFLMSNMRSRQST